MADLKLDSAAVDGLSRTEKIELTALLEERARRQMNKGYLHIQVAPEETNDQALARTLERHGLTETGTQHWFKFYFGAPRSRS